MLFLVSQVGCAGRQVESLVAPAETTNQSATTVKDEEFPERAAAALKSTARDPKTKLLLAGIVQYQLERADKLFSSGHVAQAEDVVTGALLLLRHDDELLSATRGRGSALLFAATVAARSGDAGRARALYELAQEVTTDDKVLGDIREHLKAITSWNASTAGATALEQAGQGARQALARSVVDPRAERYLDARSQIIDWMQAALRHSSAEVDPSSSEERELALESYRAVRTGAPAMIALNLRQGTPASAISALEDADLERALPPGVRALLSSASEQNDPDAWLELFRQLEGLRTEGPSETQLPRYLADGASLWAAIGLYRASEGGVDNAMPLSMILVEFGMPEVASVILADNCSAETTDEALAWSISLVLRGLLELSSSDQLLAARRSFAEAGPLFQLAQRDGYRGPSPARAYMLMAALETRYGHVPRALPLLESSVSMEQSAGVYLRLAQLQFQQKETKAALSSVKRAVDLAQNSGDLLLESEAEEVQFRFLRSMGELADAEQALERALSRVLVLRNMDVSLQRAAPVERQLASILGYYGRETDVRSAYDRALEASGSDLLELEVTLTDMARAALTLGDVRLARLATQSAIDFGLPAENLIYIALWQQLLESRSSTTRDGLSREVLSRAEKARGWLGTLRKFGLGEIPQEQLSAAASGIPERAEADFYQALSGPQGDSALNEIAASPAVDLIEVRIAQDLVAEAPVFELPEDVVLP